MYQASKQISRRDKKEMLYQPLYIIILKSFTVGIIHTIAMVAEMLFFPVLFLFTLKKNRKGVDAEKI